jgi:hypothetical protein
MYTGLSGVTTEQRLLRRQRSPAEALNARQSAQRSGTCDMAHRTLYSTCSVRHRTSRRAQQSELQRSNPNDRVTWLAHRTVSGVHRTVRCALRQLTSPTAIFWLVAINTTPTGHFKVWEPKKHSKSSS